MHLCCCTKIEWLYLSMVRWRGVATANLKNENHSRCYCVAQRRREENRGRGNKRTLLRSASSRSSRSRSPRYKARPIQVKARQFRLTEQKSSEIVRALTPFSALNSFGQNIECPFIITRHRVSVLKRAVRKLKVSEILLLIPLSFVEMISSARL